MKNKRFQAALEISFFNGTKYGREKLEAILSGIGDAHQELTPAAKSKLSTPNLMAAAADMVSLGFAKYRSPKN